MPPHTADSVDTAGPADSAAPADTAGPQAPAGPSQPAAGAPGTATPATARSVGGGTGPGAATGGASVGTHLPGGTPAPLAAVRAGPWHLGPDEVPQPDGAPLVLAHGFTQNAAAWGPLLDHLAGDRPVVAVDLPGHGRSSHLHCDLWGAATMVAATGGTGDYLGYSLGGRVCLHLALSQPHTVRRLVLVGATAGIADPTARAARRAADEALADRIATEPLDQFLAQWLAQPLFRTLAPGGAAMEARLANTSAGLAASLRSCGTGTQEPLWDRLHSLTMPVLLIAGVLDLRFTMAATAMARAIGPSATVALVPGAGHASHLERAAYVGTLVRRFLA